MANKPCEYCQKNGCHGECENYILEMAMAGTKIDGFERLFREIPKFNYVLNEKINSIFGTDLEVASNSDVQSDLTNQFNQFLYATNENGNTNLYEIKKAIKHKEIFGESYLFFDNINVYALTKDEVEAYSADETNPIIDAIQYYTVGTCEVPDVLQVDSNGFIKQDTGYIIFPSNMIKFKSDEYVLNSDLKQLQILLEINRKIYDSTTKRDYGDLFLFTDTPQVNMISAVAQRVKDSVNTAIEKMRERVAELIKRNKVDDSNVVVLDETYKDVKQIAPITKVTDYQFIWEHQDEILSSVFNFPMLLAGLGDDAGNVSKSALLQDARANTLTPIKSDTANSLSVIARKLFGEQYYLRFQDYPDELIQS